MAPRASLAAVVVGGAVAVFAAPAQAGLDDARCDGSLPSVFERSVQVQREQRRTFGLPSSRAHVVRLLRDPRYNTGTGFPVTPRERAWLVDRDTLGARAVEVDRYARKHAPDSYGATTAEARWPKPAYFLARFTRDVARHQRALERRFDRRVHVVKVRYTHAYLRRLQDKIDIAELADRGIRFVSAGVNVWLNRVRLAVVTARNDVRRTVRSLYGGGVHVEVAARDDWKPVCRVADSYSTSEDGRVLTIHYWSGGRPFRFHHLALDERGPGARVEVHEREVTGAHILPCDFRHASVTLAAPLGDRKVVDGETGRNLPPGDGTPHRACGDRYYDRGYEPRR